MIRFKKSSPFSGMTSNLPKTSGSRNLLNLASSTVLTFMLISTQEPSSNSISSRWSCSRSSSKNSKTRSATAQLRATALRLVTPNQVKVRVVEVERSIEMTYHLLSQLTSPKKRRPSRNRRTRRSRRKNKKSRNRQKSLTKSKIRKLKRKRRQIQRLKKRQMENLK